MIIKFSYIISEEETVALESLGKPRLRPKTRISKGDRSNTSFIDNLTTHVGTHIDVPYHMISDGVALDQFDINGFIFHKPLFLELLRNDLDKITVDDLSNYENEMRDCDILMLYTGFSKYRSGDPDRYLNSQPGLSEEAARYLTGFSNIRSVGIDLVGIENIPEGRRKLYPVHKILFKAFKKLIILEDANLASLAKKTIKKVYVIPLFVKGADGSPVTAFAEVE